MKHPRLIFVCCLLFSALLSAAQERSNLRVRRLCIKADTLVLDTLSYEPSSLRIESPRGTATEGKDYLADWGYGRIIIRNHDLFRRGDTLTALYRVYPFLLGKTYSNKSMTVINRTPDALENPFLFTYTNTTEDVFNWSGLNRNGSISRGISFGNNQDVVGNSTLNLQLSGHLSEDIEVLAAITDNNIPIQPEGNTQQIQEFDKVYIQLFNENNRLTAGDFEIQRPPSYFMNFYKKAQGGMLTSRLNTGAKREGKQKGPVVTLSGAGAVSKGRYARNILQGSEGNQGPYRLTGANNETYIIVLAGTEKVYIDGRLLTRGQENDYVIDYNLGEIIFMPRNMITRDKRIVVEFEYTDRNFGPTTRATAASKATSLPSRQCFPGSMA